MFNLFKNLGRSAQITILLTLIGPSFYTTKLMAAEESLFDSPAAEASPKTDKDGNTVQQSMGRSLLFTSEAELKKFIKDLNNNGVSSSDYSELGLNSSKQMYVIPLRPSSDDSGFSWNKTMSEFNGKVYYFFKPVADTYVNEPNLASVRWVFQRVSNIFSNLDEAIIGSLSNLFTGNFEDSGRSLARSMLNLVFGLGGMFDPATALSSRPVEDTGVVNLMGIEKQVSNSLSYDIDFLKPPKVRSFGDVLKHWDLDCGPYLVLPIIGSNTIDQFAAKAAEIPLHAEGYIHPAAPILRVVGNIHDSLGTIHKGEQLFGDINLTTEEGLKQFEQLSRLMALSKNECLKEQDVLSYEKDGDPVYSLSAIQDEVEHPKQNELVNLANRPFLQSLPGLFVHPTDGVEFDELKIGLYPERKNLEPVGDFSEMIFRYHLQDDPSAPLVFVSPGTGGTANSSTTLYVAEQIASLGYSVVTLPSTTHLSFALGVSHKGRIGYLPYDGRDLFRLLSVVRNRLVRENEITPRFYGYVGYSYGGLDAAFTALEDQRLHYFDFKFVAMINPPLDREISIQKVDKYFAYGKHFSPEKYSSLVSFTAGRFLDISNGNRPFTNPVEWRNAFPLKESAMSWMMGKGFRDSLMDTAFAGDLINNENSNKYMAMPSTIESYINNKVLKPIAERRHTSINQLHKECQLNWALEQIKQKSSGSTAIPRFYLFHAKNDFLSFPEGNSMLSKFDFPIFLYDSGGHLGNLALPEFIHNFKGILAREYYR